MPEEEKNRYFEQARQATLAEIGLNQQAMLDNVAQQQQQAQPTAPISEAQVRAVPDVPDYGQRADGTRKGSGYFGPLKTANGDVATEYSIGVDFDGKETEIPTLVPTLTDQEVSSMLNDIIPNGKDIPEAIYNKAVEHARQRMDSGRSVFADENDTPREYRVPAGKFSIPYGIVEKANEAAGKLSETPFDDVMDELEATKKEQERQAAIKQILDPRVQRAENSRKWVAGIGDALASIANLVGTGNNASNQPQTYMTPAVNAAVEQDRKRRNTQYNKQMDRINKLNIQLAKNEVAEKQLAAKAAENEKNRALQEKKIDANIKLNKDKFDANQKQQEFTNALNTRKQEEKEANDKQQIALGYYRVNKGDNTPGGDNEGRGRFAGKRLGGTKEAKIDYNAMLDEIAERNGCNDWADLANKAQNDRNLRRIHNMFDLGKDKAGASKIEGMISNYARNWAPDFWAYYFGEDKNDNIDFSGYKPSAAGSAGAAESAPAGGALDKIMSSGSETKKKRGFFGRK